MPLSKSKSIYNTCLTLLADTRPRGSERPLAPLLKGVCLCNSLLLMLSIVLNAFLLQAHQRPYVPREKQRQEVDGCPNCKTHFRNYPPPHRSKPHPNSCWYVFQSSTLRDSERHLPLISLANPPLIRRHHQIWSSRRFHKDWFCWYCEKTSCGRVSTAQGQPGHLSFDYWGSYLFSIPSFNV